MEIENDTKAKVFAQYLGQQVLWGGTEGVLWSYNLHGASDVVLGAKLILKPLSKITDEDAQDLGYEDAEIFIATSPWLKKYHGDKSFWDAQILQSKGYDLPNYLLNGKTLQEAGLAIYE